MSEEIEHIAIRVSGTVQGVGFRPFIHNLAGQHRLAGVVLNNNCGVLIHAQGPPNHLQVFLEAVRHAAPTAAHVEGMEITPLPIADYVGFHILPSEIESDGFTLIPPDLALCSDCRRELDDHRNHRFAYPFINCIQCGPRFTIVRGLPYDRPQTTMSVFAMCPECRQEYEDPIDRRYHTQPVCCRRCGPELRLFAATPQGWVQKEHGEAVIAHVVQALKDRKIALIQGIGGFHLACDACDEELVLQLRRRKQRDEKPFAVMFPSERHVREDCEVTEAELDLLRSPRAPIVLLRRRAGSSVASAVAPENPFVGSMLPYSPLHLLLLREFDRPVVMTSANLTDEPIAYRLDDALARLRRVADVALTHNREIHIFADDSVVRVIGGSTRIWRRSRGYVPQPVKVPERFHVHTLAFGPQLKNTFCLGRENVAVLSQHLGDMDTEQAIEAQHVALEHFLHLFDARVELGACDLHPDYTTTRIAQEWCNERGIPLVHVQHHHAHLAACLAENGEMGPAIGLCLDGTGYGTDGTIWGGEVLVGDACDFSRAAHLQEVPLLGGEQAVREPWRMALAWLHGVFGERLFNLSLGFAQTVRTEIGEDAMRVLLNPGLIVRAFPSTSSLGRLFDAVAALLFFGVHSQYEGQAAMQLEWQMSASPEKPYPFDICQSDDHFVLSPEPMFHALVDDLGKGVPTEIVSRRFHEGIVEGFARMCEMVGESVGIRTVALSGGCFQNVFLESVLTEKLLARGYRVLTHHHVPTNDGGVALGQAFVANAQGG